MNYYVLLIFAPLLILTGILGFIIPAKKSLTSGAPAYNIFHIIFGLIGIMIATHHYDYIRAFNVGYGAGIPNITDIEALRLMGIDPDQPFFDWLGRLGITNKSFQADSEGDGLSQLAEFAFGLNPQIGDADRLPVRVGGRVAGFTGEVSVRFTPRADRARYVAVRVQYSTDAIVWNALPAARLLSNTDGSFTGVIPPLNGPVHIRLRVITIPPSGSGARNVSHIAIR